MFELGPLNCDVNDALHPGCDEFDVYQTNEDEHSGKSMNEALIKTSCKSALQILSISGIRNTLIVPTGKDVYIEQDKSKKDVVLRYQSRGKTFSAYSGASGLSPDRCDLGRGLRRSLDP